MEETVNREIRNQKNYQLEYRIRHKDGTPRHVFEKARGIYTEEGTPLYIEGVLLDITERKVAEERVRYLNRKLEERVRERTMQLEHANRELEAFAYSISHDLRVPLRAVNGFSRALEEDYTHLLDNQGRNFLARIRSGALRLDERIQDLLRLSRLTRAPMEPRKLDLTVMAKQILEDLERGDPERSVKISVLPNMTAFGDAGLIRIALENLLHNAWKFTRKREEASILFGHVKRGNQEIFFIEDNGAGFDMAQGERLFTVFQRLHEEEDFPGNGIGLATAQRIIHRHGGHIWAEAVPDKGATFFFTLPKRSGLSEETD